MIDQIFNSGVSAIIVLVAFAGYQQLWIQYLERHNPATQSTDLATVLIAVLPLLGLLGTIMGLLQCFSQLGSGSSALSDGIGKALFTTQLSLVCGIPGWLLQAYIHSVSTATVTQSHTQITPSEVS